MKEYLRWSLRELYLLVFWPTKFEAEKPEALWFNRGFSLRRSVMLRRFNYLLKMLPWIVLFAVAGNLISGISYAAWTGHAFRWHESWLVVAVNVAFAVGLAVTVGVAGGVTFGVAFGVAGGIALGVTFGVTFGVALGVAGGVAIGVAGGVAGGVAFWLTYVRLPVFSLDAILAWMRYGLLAADGVEFRKAWRRHPLAWNEVIWLPLPRAAEFLALLVKADRDFGFEKIAFVAAERRLQIRAARMALREVLAEDLRMGGIAGAEAVARRLEWMADPPLSMPDEATMAAPAFTRIAAMLSQSGVLQSHYRRREVLENADAELDTLRKQLAGHEGDFAPELLRRANEWHALIETGMEQARIAAVESGEIPQVFRFSKPVRENEDYVFTGRQGEVRELDAVLMGDTSPPAILLRGARRMGKSSILCQLPRLLGADCAPCQVDCSNSADNDSLPRLLHAIARELSAGLRRRGVPIAPPEIETMREEPFGVFDDWLREAEAAMVGRFPRMRALICLDEFEMLDKLARDWGWRLLDYLRHLVQHHPRLLLLFAGARDFQTLGREWTARFVNARAMRVSFLTADELRPLLTAPVQPFPLRYGPGALESLLAATNGQPFLTQAVAYELVKLLNREHRQLATLADIETACVKAMDSGVVYFQNVWDDTEADGHALLAELVGGKHPGGAPPGPLRTRLTDMDVLDAGGRIAVPLLARWIRESLATNRLTVA